MPNLVAYRAAEPVGRAEFDVVSAIIDRREHGEQCLALPNADRRIVLRGQQRCACGCQKQKNRYLPGKQLKNQEGLPQRDWDEWISERSLRASLRRVKRGQGLYIAGKIRLHPEGPPLAQAWGTHEGPPLSANTRSSQLWKPRATSA